MKRFLLLAIGLTCVVLALAGCRAASPQSPPSEARTPEPEPTVAEHLHGTVAEVELPYRDCGHAKLVGGELYVTVDVGSDVGIDTLVRFNPESGASEVIFNAPEGIAWMDASDEWVVWETALQLWARPVQGGDDVLLGTFQDIYAPKIVGDVVAWTDRQEGGDFDIVVEDLSERTVRKIADVSLPGFYNNFVDFDGQRVLWTDVIDGEGLYRVADVETGEIQDFPVRDTKYRYPGYAKFADDRFYSINFADCYVWDWTIQEFGYCSKEAGTFVPVIHHGSVGFTSESAGRVGVLDREGSLLLFDAEDPAQTENLSEELGVTFDMLGEGGQGVLIGEVSKGAEYVGTTTVCIIDLP